MVVNLGKRFHNALEMLLPSGHAWTMRGCESSLMSLFLRAISEELARFQVWYELVLKWSIERFGELPTGWSADDYEALLKSRFNISAIVTDGLQGTNCESHCEALVISPRCKYLFVINVDDVSVITSDVIVYLNEYKQSHTDFIVRDKAVTLELDRTFYEYFKLNCESVCTDPASEQDYVFHTDKVFHALTCESACTDPVFERDYAYYKAIAHWSYSDEELIRLPSWPSLIAQLPDNAVLSRGAE